MIALIKQNTLSFITALLIMYLSLANANTIDKVAFINFPHIDKVVHFGMYFILMISLLYEHRKTNKELKGQLIMAVVPLIYGILLEIIQSAFTLTRSGDVFDAVFNFIGILIAVFTWRLFFYLRKSEN